MTVYVSYLQPLRTELLYFPILYGMYTVLECGVVVLFYKFYWLKKHPLSENSTAAEGHEELMEVGEDQDGDEHSAFKELSTV